MFEEHSDLSSRRVCGRTGKGRPNPPLWHRRRGAATAPPSCLAGGGSAGQGSPGSARWGGGNPREAAWLWTPRGAEPSGFSHSHCPQGRGPGCGFTHCGLYPAAQGSAWLGDPQHPPARSKVRLNELHAELSQELLGRTRLLGQGGGLDRSRTERAGSGHPLLLAATPRSGHGNMVPVLLGLPACSIPGNCPSLGTCQGQDTRLLPTPSLG